MPRKSKIDTELEEIVEEKEAQEETVEKGRSTEEQDNETRSEVAKKFIKYYFWILIGILLLTPIFNLIAAKYVSKELVTPLKDLVLTYSAIVGPTLGLVIAYYFKSRID